ncbi:iron transporter [Niveispirillum sp. KHB5.9]|uniref:iron transporter n=1 Tax=Niveispirillum sp. KHB5.9 TaxID=3400269 RepID=UPI003A882C7D
MARKAVKPTPRQRIDVALRALAAIAGGYGVAAATTAFLARVLPLSRVEVTNAAMLSSFLVFVAVALWAFSARSVARVWAIILPLAGGMALFVHLGLGMHAP